MGEVIQFVRDGRKPHHRDHDKPIIPVKTVDDVFADVYEDIIGEWQRYAIRNRLNEFITSKIPASLRTIPEADFTNDLNALAAVENKLQLRVSLFWPGGTTANPYGWIAGFHKDTKIFTTPADMSSEANARALNILLYLGLENQLRSLSGSLK
jgi:hypothetical protein